MGYKPIEDYAVIGDMHTVALVSKDGSIDWMCFPYFDSPSVFGALLDDRKGGRFRITAAGEHAHHKQFYWSDTNVLVTRFLSPDGAAELTDFMPVGKEHEGKHRHHVIRILNVVRGSMEFELECSPAFNYARDDHKVSLIDGGAMFSSRSLELVLGTKTPLKVEDKRVGARFTLKEGETAVFVLSEVRSGSEQSMYVSSEEADDLRRETINYWKHWIAQCEYNGRWQEIVHRSALALKLMTFEPTGAIVAAPTTSLPEHIGGNRNWDYRYTWIRDSAFTIYAFLRLGFKHEAEQFMGFLSRIRTENGKGETPLQVMYGIDGRTNIDEEVLGHLEGYRGSRPVRVGNDAHKQLQLDIYGELMDSIYLYNKYAAPISHSHWVSLTDFVNWVAKNWERKDQGIWEERDEGRHHTYSKLMCWVAMDRALRLAQKRSFPCDIEHWTEQRDRIYTQIMEKGWNEQRGAFVQSYDNDSLDASTLMMPLVLFLSPADPRLKSTIMSILKPPHERGLTSNNLVYRYNSFETKDGLPGKDGTFNICTFWLVEAMTRAGRFEPKLMEDARMMFERMLGYANHVGLFSEETGPSGEAIGNFPQAFTHLSLISAAVNLERHMGGRA